MSEKNGTNNSNDKEAISFASNGDFYTHEDGFSVSDLKEATASDFTQEIVDELSFETFLNNLTDQAVEQRETDKSQSLLDIITTLTQSTNWEQLTEEGDDTGGNEIDTTIDEPYTNAIIQRILGDRENTYRLSQKEREPLLVYRHEQLKKQNNPIEVVQALYPAIDKQKLTEAEKLEMVAKISILMMILPVPKIDEFIESNILLDKILQGKNYAETIDETLREAMTLDLKNDGIGYNYRVDQLMEFLMAAEEGLGDVPEWLGQNQVINAIRRRMENEDDTSLQYFKQWYDYISNRILVFNTIEVQKGSLYLLYVFYCKLFVQLRSPPKGHNIKYLTDLICIPVEKEVFRIFTKILENPFERGDNFWKNYKHFGNEILSFLSEDKNEERIETIITHLRGKVPEDITIEELQFLCINLPVFYDSGIDLTAISDVLKEKIVIIRSNLTDYSKATKGYNNLEYANRISCSTGNFPELVKTSHISTSSISPYFPKLVKVDTGILLNSAELANFPELEYVKFIVAKKTKVLNCPKLRSGTITVNKDTKVHAPLIDSSSIRRQ